MRPTWLWRPLAYALLAACALAATSTRFDSTELGACIAVFGFGLLGEVGGRSRRTREQSPLDGMTSTTFQSIEPGSFVLGGATFRTVTVYDCGGEGREVITENPPPADVTLEQHLELHAASVLADAEAAGCA